MMRWNNVILWRIAVAVAFFGLWQLASGWLFDPFWVSKPSAILASIWHSMMTGQLWSDLYATFRSTLLGYAIGSVTGLLAGLLLGQSETAAQVLRPFVLAIYGIPRIALAPIFVLWFGIAMMSKVMMAGMVTFMLVFFNTYDGVRAADLELRNVARVLGSGRGQLFWHVTIPNASPWIIAGLRIAIPQALVAAVVAEFIASTQGIGYRLMESTNTLDTAGVMAYVFVLMIIVLILSTVLDRVEAYVLRWRPTQNQAGR